MNPDLTIELQNALYLVPTPIGNLDDITLRAMKVLANVDIIACEDTRRTGNLLKMYSIPHKKLESYHEYNEVQKATKLVSAIEDGNSVALVSDAGSPMVSDPGYRIVRAAIEKDVEIVALPGATAFVPALSASGFPINEFVFLGFAPQKKGRKSFLSKISDIDRPVVLYESPYRLLKLLDELREVIGESRNICIAKEISKIHESYLRGNVLECRQKLITKESLKGEFVIIIDRKASV